MRSLWAQEQSYATAIDDINKQTQLSQELQAKYQSFAPRDLTTIEKTMPALFDATKFAAEINGIATAYGASVKNVKGVSAALPDQSVVSTPTNTTAYRVTQVSFDVDMTYEHFTAFLRDMETNLRLLDVTAISFKPASVKDTSLYSFTISAKTYSLK